MESNRRGTDRRRTPSNNRRFISQTDSTVTVQKTVQRHSKCRECGFTSETKTGDIPADGSDEDRRQEETGESKNSYAE